MTHSSPAARVLATAAAIVLLLTGAPASRAKTLKSLRAQKAEQQFTFADIVWYTPGSSAIEALGAKGYRAIPGTREAVVAQGKMFEHTAVARGMLDDSARVVRWEVTIFAASTGDRFAEMKPIYEQIVTECGNRYGSAWDVAEKYKFPYDKGDHRETSALEDGKAMIHAIWRAKDQDHRLVVEMNKDTNVLLTYSCPGWTAFQDRVRHGKARDL